MAKFNIFAKKFLFLSMVIMISSILVFAQEKQNPDDIIEQHIIPAGAPDDYAKAPEVYPDAPPPDSESKDDEYRRECADRMTLECSKLVFFYMFDEGSNVTKSCCGELVKMGRPCHIALVNGVFTLPDYRANATVGIARSKELWNKCADLIVDADTSAPVSL